eukprot:m.49475 g.49475  ORF g.49475 m.49475 type:complete len:514 (+) comp12826_c1_seq1:2177-3718(+)
MADKGASAGVKGLINRLDASHIAEREAARKAAEEERARQLAEQQALQAAAHAEKEAAAQRLELARLQEKQKYTVSEEDCAKDVAERKRQFLERMKTPKPKVEVKIEKIPTIVIDLGSNTVKAGFAGQDAPKFVLSSVVGGIRSEHIMDLEKHKHIDRDFYVGDEAWAYKDILQIKRVLQRGVVKEWDHLRRLLEHLFYQEMKLTPESIREHPVLISEEPLNPKGNREKIAELLFNHFNVPALFVANTSTLALYASQRITGVVVDIGYGVSTSVAVYDGDVLPNTLRRLNIGGYDLDLYLMRLMNEKGYRFNELNVFDNFIIRDLKERTCYVAPDYDAELKRIGNSDVKSKWAKGGNSLAVKYDVTGHGNDMLPGYEKKGIPDEITIEKERFQCAEALFDPQAYLGQDTIIPGVHKMVMETIKACPIDLVKEMYGNIVLSGGTTLLEGFADRLRHDLREIAPPSVLIQIDATKNRHLGAWIGGSILASVKSFNPHWISLEEYRSIGKDIVHAPL